MATLARLESREEKREKDPLLMTQYEFRGFPLPNAVTSTEPTTVELRYTPVYTSKKTALMIQFEF